MHPIFIITYAAFAAMVTLLFSFLVRVVRKDTALPGGRIIPVPIVEVALVLVLVAASLYFSPPKLAWAFAINALIIGLGWLLMSRHGVLLKPLLGIPWNPLRTLATAFWISLALCPLAGFLVVINQYLCKTLELPSEGQSLHDILLHSNDFPLLAKVIVLSIIIAPAAEEFLVRAVVQSALRQYMNASAAIILTSILFSALHLTPSVFLPLMFNGIVFGIAFERKGSLPFNILIHSCSNVLFIIVTFAERFYGQPGTLPGLG
ncbi:MAG: lysostaphin resistance A-like protein [Candidatus Methylacidiphilales bacterium]|nr:type II CAAX endopeptidase family protein [Candidatus Methylacidiphilales bacterium]